MTYLTYEEYSNMGGVLDLTAFNRSIYKACGVIDEHTHCRLQKGELVSDMVKACICELVEYISNNSTAKNITSKSQSAGGVSESESYSTKSVNDMSEDMYDIIRSYLSNELDIDGVPLLYRGASNVSHRDTPREPIKVKFKVKYGWNEIEIPR